MTIIQERLAQLETLELLKGSHYDNNGKCALEAVAWLVGEKHSDHPACVSPVLGAFCRSWNDSLDDVNRQKLKPYLVRLIGTAGDAARDQRRSWMAMDWLARVCGPVFMDLTPSLRGHASALRALPEMVDGETLAAGDAVRAAAGDAARDAAWGAAWGAAGAAARDAARVVARDAAWDAAWAAVRAATRAATWDAVRDAAGDAAGAARRIVDPVVAQLQKSAFDLLDRMINV